MLNLCVQNLYTNPTHVGNLTKSSFYSLLKLTIFESFIIVNGQFYEPCDDVAMGSLLGPTLAKSFMCHFEKIWLKNCPVYFKPIAYRRFVDDTHLLFQTNDNVEKFKRNLKKQHKNIKLTSEIEEKASFSFLDKIVGRENNKYITPAYCKPTFNGVFTNFKVLH